MRVCVKSQKSDQLQQCMSVRTYDCMYVCVQACTCIYVGVYMYEGMSSVSLSLSCVCARVHVHVGA